MTTPLEIDVQKLKSLKDGTEPFCLVDVREPDEVAVGRIEGSLHIPLAQLAARAGELPKDRWIIMQCRSGMRSMRATQWARANGIPNVSNLAGGIVAWAQKIDPSVKVA